MFQVTFEYAAAHFVELVERVVSTGEEIIILRGATPVAKLVPIPKEELLKSKRPGYGEGKNDVLYMADDFDAPLEDFKD